MIGLKRSRLELIKKELWQVDEALLTETKNDESLGVL